MTDPESFNHAPMSYSQRSLWFLEELGTTGSTYNIPFGWVLEGELNREALKKAIAEIVQRHEALRTTFGQVGEDVVQIIGATAPYGMVERALDGDDDVVAAGRRVLGDMAREPFDLERGPLFRLALLTRSSRTSVLLFVVHHIVFDERSAEVFTRELDALYRSFDQGLPSPLAAVALQYADYAEWQRELLAGEVLKTQGAYWQRVLDGAPQTLNLPFDRARPAVMSHRGGAVEFALAPTAVAALKSLCRQEKTTLFMALIAVFGIELSRHSGQDDLCIGYPVSGRSGEELDDLIGFFVNTQVLRIRVLESQSFIELLSQVRESAIGATQHQDLPFEKLVELQRPERRLDHMPLFQAMFTLTTGPKRAATASGLRMSPLPEPSTRHAICDLTLDLNEVDGQLVGAFEFSTDLFDQATIERMAAQFDTLLKQVTDAPHLPLREVSLLTQEERRRILVEWNDSTAEFSRDQCLHQLFEACARVHMDSTALVFEGRAISYAALDRRSNQLANHLIRHGVRRGALVGLRVPRSIDMFVGIFGILKAGAAYVPLALDLPDERIGALLASAGAVALLQPHREGGAVTFACPTLPLNGPAVEAESAARPDVACHPLDLAYCLFTSGSTGQPKGVMTPHLAVVNQLLAMPEYLRSVPEGPRHSLMKTALSFDPSWLEIGRLLHGYVVHIIPESDVLSPSRMRDTFLAVRPQMYDCTPSELKMLLGSGEDIESVLPPFVLLGGESIDQELWNRLAGISTSRFYNFYGPTESTIDATCAEIAPSSRTTIGRALANKRLYLLDDHLRPVPVGVPGILYVAGEMLARGYLADPVLTAQKFLPDPFHGAGERMYCTGDRARWRADGRIEFLGRIDHQLKIRGMRVEPGEIETTILQLPSIRACVVVPVDLGDGDRQLAAYVVPRGDAVLAADELRRQLKHRLPEHMVPSAWCVLDALPLNANGKLDRSRLPPPTSLRNETAGVFNPPRSASEKSVAEVWSQVLGADRIGLSDTFFGLGGHSLQLAKVSSLLRQRLGREVPMQVLYSDGPLASLAQAIDELLLSRALPLLPENIQLLRRQHGGDGNRILVLIHTFSGLCASYAKLVEALTVDVTIYGVVAPFGQLPSAAESPVESLAALYAGQLAPHLEGAELTLCGYCVGGLIAMEITRILESRSRQKIRVIVLSAEPSLAPIDHGLPARQKVDALWREYVRTIARSRNLHLMAGGSSFRRLTRVRRIAHLLALRGSDASDYSLQIDRKYLVNHFKFVCWMLGGAREYMANRIASPLTLVLPSNEMHEYLPIWRAMSDQPVNVHVENTSHCDLLNEQSSVSDIKKIIQHAY